MGVTGNLATLRQGVLPLGGEVMIEGWAAERICGDERVLGLVLVTSWRIVFVAPRSTMLSIDPQLASCSRHGTTACSCPSIARLRWAHSPPFFDNIPAGPGPNLVSRALPTTLQIHP